MSTIEHSIDVEVPITVAYNQWTQFESFPEFMEGVESVKQISDTRTAWVAEIAGVRREFEADITEQHPDERIAWRTTDKPHQAGVVTFHRLDDNTTRVTLQMEYDPEGFVETAGDWLQLVRLRVVGDMKRFKMFIESRGGETGGWRGDVPGPHQRGSTYGGDQPVPPGTVGGDNLPPSDTLPPPGPKPPGTEPPEGPRPVM
ncbi:SRPBCC family protein [Nonomuraea turcica]|uniref:SRPBCC family protein n=1 Tax=Nonomuraea sp. G32 TaxID=3067274 RepID=UPI00273AAE61|nr:SRPBCC family protein [Nonomuraea sp. G32]MDP4508830.1 SRPBCC family protein [Nonomuraea sp. G32]